MGRRCNSSSLMPAQNFLGISILDRNSFMFYPERLSSVADDCLLDGRASRLPVLKRMIS